MSIFPLAAIAILILCGGFCFWSLAAMRMIFSGQSPASTIDKRLLDSIY